MSNLTPSEITRKRIAKWMLETKPVTPQSTWTEKRQAIDFGGKTYIITNGQVFQCGHCGTYDPVWNATEVLTFFRDNFGIKPYDIEVTCSVAVVENE